jgi:ABC-type enterochelin transport system ATPase subunit
MESTISVSGLTKYYGDLLAVDHISFEMSRSKIFGFMSPNGAGKTTTIRMLTGISIPTEGTALIMGYDIRRQSIEAKEQRGSSLISAMSIMNSPLGTTSSSLALYGLWLPFDEHRGRGQDFGRDERSPREAFGDREQATRGFKTLNLVLLAHFFESLEMNKLE